MTGVNITPVMTLSLIGPPPTSINQYTKSNFSPQVEIDDR